MPAISQLSFPPEVVEEVRRREASPWDIAQIAALGEFRTPRLETWVATVNAQIGYDLTVPSVHPVRDAADRWILVLHRLGYAGDIREWLEPWADVVAEDARAYDQILLEDWPTE